MGEREVRIERDWLGDEVQVIYEDDVKVGEYRFEQRDRTGTGLFEETVKVEYDADGNEVGYTRQEQRDPLGLGLFSEDVDVDYDAEDREVGWSRVEERDVWPGLGTHHERIGYNVDDEEVSQTSWERRGRIFGDERVRVTRYKDSLPTISTQARVGHAVGPMRRAAPGIGTLCLIGIILIVIVVPIALRKERHPSPVVSASPATPARTTPPAPKHDVRIMPLSDLSPSDRKRWTASFDHLLGEVRSRDADQEILIPPGESTGWLSLQKSRYNGFYAFVPGHWSVTFRYSDGHLEQYDFTNPTSFDEYLAQGPVGLYRYAIEHHVIITEGRYRNRNKTPTKIKFWFVSGR